MRAAGYAGAAVASSINVAAILSGTFSIGLGGGGIGGRGAGGGGTFGDGLGGGTAGFLRDGFGGFGSTTFSPIGLPFAGLLRSENVVAAVAVGQTIALVALVAIWLALVLKPACRVRELRRVPASVHTAVP